MNKSVLKDKSVACQGVDGAYSHQAAMCFVKEPQITYTRTFKGVFDRVASGVCEYGVLPLENSNAGTVRTVYHLMLQFGGAFFIYHSLKMQISHCLLAPKGATSAQISDIFTHEQAAAQCGAFIEANPAWRVHIRENTALAAKYIAQSRKPGQAAIASAHCASLYGLEILQSGIEDYAHNYTRFILISKHEKSAPQAEKLSLMLSLPHRPGALFDCLKIFAEHEVNLTKIESIPIAGSDFEFMFYIDAQTGQNPQNTASLIDALKREMNAFVYLGSYNEDNVAL